MCQSHLCKLKYYISNMGTESFAFIKQKRLTISYVISTFWTSKTCNLCISILCVVDITIYIMAAVYLCTIYTIVFVCIQLCGICLHTIVWYLCTIYTIVFVCIQLCGICLHTIVWYLSAYNCVVFVHTIVWYLCTIYTIVFVCIQLCGICMFPWFQISGVWELLKMDGASFFKTLALQSKSSALSPGTM